MEENERIEEVHADEHITEGNIPEIANRLNYYNFNELLERKL